MPISVITLRTGILYSIITCGLISLSCLYSAYLISLKSKKSAGDSSLAVFLNTFGLYWLIYMISNIFGWLNITAGYKYLSFILAFLLFMQPVHLFFYFIRNRSFRIPYAILGLVFYFLSVSSLWKLTTVSYWGVNVGFATIPKLVFIFCLMAPLAAVAANKLVTTLKEGRKDTLIASIAMLFVTLETIKIVSVTLSWKMLLFRMFYMLIGIMAYFSLTGEEATARFIEKMSPKLADRLSKVRQMRIPFFAKLLMLFMLLSVLPIAGAGIIMFLTFKEIIDLYIYKPLLWNLKTSKEEFLIALGNVQVQALLLIIIAIILVITVSSIASRAIAQSLKRIGYGMKRIEEGDLGYKVQPESNDEIGDLANYFNKMASEIKHSREIMENWNKELEKTVEERTKNLRTLYNLSKAIGSTLDLDELLKKSMDNLPLIEGTKYISIFVKDDKGTFRSKVAKGLEKKFSFNQGEGLFGQAVSGEQIVKIADINEASQGEKEFFSPLALRTMLLVPMERKGIKTGLIAIGISKEYLPSDIELNLLSTIADQMAIGIENANVYEKEREAVKRLLEIDKMKTELISMVSHELRTPLTSIKGFLSHFISGTTGPLNETQLKFANIMSKEGDHLLELIDTLLEFSKVERGVFSIKKEPVQIDRLINGTVDVLRPQIDAKGIKVVLNLSSANASFLGDEVKAGQLLRNIIVNAIKFVKEDPRIEISSRVLPDNMIEVRIKDNGIGIEKGHLERIFDKFYQVDTSLTRKVGGLGLGLAIAKEIVEAHGGRIFAESEGSGKGSAFIFTLPMIK